ncbi:hypothetical protein MAR_023305 [Mya arenaria]|uniref:Regulatory factor X-associated protein RFXANK-binding domain-containing protein n=1 Tax=Mya arenaria TaxID=6604 RepID=A0ABY7DMM7_MYAAR|nr:hypothetical protein MAR_023305 [Mya arenaria]
MSKMEVEGSQDEDVEGDYFQQAGGYEDPPTFTLGHSTKLQGSQGFQVHRTSELSGPLASSEQQDRSGSRMFMQGMMSNFVDFQTIVPSVTCAITQTQSIPEGFNGFNALFLQGNHFNPVQGSIPTAPREILPHPGAVKVEEGTGDSEEGGGREEDRLDKHKTSHKPRGRKSRSSCSSATQSELCLKVEDPDPPVMSDSGFQPSLEEILAEKKMALMRSPEVIAFLKQQQQLGKQQHLARPDS